ncbi:carbohydrate ABC transporter permease [Cohnella cellulosilytica]|uniref:Carbohydrate ABC transporter permease n=2 Tax=Cohnella cellulosilytica TaxID=986710 RepID=A0ABW2F7Y8_9BACL
MMLLGGAVFALLPLYWLVRSSLMDTVQIFEMPPVWVPHPIHWDNYAQALTILPFARYFLNTALIVAGVVAGTLISSSISAFAFARLKWKGRDTVFGILMTGMMLPFAVTLIPTFIGWSALGLTDTYAPLIIPAWFGGGMANVFLLRQFYTTLPQDLDEAAIMDGASAFTIFLKVVLPLSKSALIVVGLFAFMGAWNDFLGPLVYISTPDKYTVALGLRQFQGMYNAEWHLMMAASAVVILPAIIVYFIGQRYFMDGIALTGIKG